MTNPSYSSNNKEATYGYQTNDLSEYRYSNPKEQPYGYSQKAQYKFDDQRNQGNNIKDQGDLGKRNEGLYNQGYEDQSDKMYKYQQGCI